MPGLGYITLKVRTSSIHEAVFDKRSNVLKIRGMVEGPMDKLDRYYDFLSHPGTRLPGAAPAQYTTPSTPSLACCCAGSPKAYLCLTFNNMNKLAEVLKAIPRLKARTTFQNGKLPGWSDTAGAGASSAPGATGAARASAAARYDERAARSRGAAVAAPAPDRGSSRRPAAGSSRRRAPSLRSTATEGARPPSLRPPQRPPPSGERGICFLFKVPRASWGGQTLPAP